MSGIPSSHSASALSTSQTQQQAPPHWCTRITTAICDLFAGAARSICDSFSKLFTRSPAQAAVPSLGATSIAEAAARVDRGDGPSSAVPESGLSTIAVPPAQSSIPAKNLAQLIDVAKSGMESWCEHAAAGDSAAVFVGKGWQPLKEDLNAVFRSGGERLDNVVRDMAERAVSAGVSAEYFSEEISQRCADISHALLPLKPFISKAYQTILTWQARVSGAGRPSATVVRNLVLEQGIAGSALRLAAVELNAERKAAFLQLAQVANHMARGSSSPLPADFPKGPATLSDAQADAAVRTATSKFSNAINEWVNPTQSSKPGIQSDRKHADLGWASASHTPDSWLKQAPVSSRDDSKHASVSAFVNARERSDGEETPPPALERMFHEARSSDSSVVRAGDFRSPTRHSREDSDDSDGTPPPMVRTDSARLDQAHVAVGGHERASTTSISSADFVTRDSKSSTLDADGHPLTPATHQTPPPKMSAGLGPRSLPPKPTALELEGTPAAPSASIAFPGGPDMTKTRPTQLPLPPKK